MEDAKVAILMISSIIGKHIEKISVLPQEFISEIEKTDYTKSSAIKVSRQYIDLMTDKIIET